MHATRKTCAPLLVALGVHPRVAMAILRDSQIAVTMDYSQVPSAPTREALRRLGASSVRGRRERHCRLFWGTDTRRALSHAGKWPLPGSPPRRSCLGPPTSRTPPARARQLVTGSWSGRTALPLATAMVKPRLPPPACRLPAASWEHMIRLHCDPTCCQRTAGLPCGRTVDLLAGGHVISLSADN